MNCQLFLVSKEVNEPAEFFPFDKRKILFKQSSALVQEKLKSHLTPY